MKTLLSITTLLLLVATLSAQDTYLCPPCSSTCDTLTFAAAGDCTHCGMELLPATAEALANRARGPLTIAFYLQDGVEVLDFAGPLEVFSYAGFEVFTVGRTRAPLTSQGVLTVTPDYGIEDAPEADILAFFGGNSGLPAGDPAVLAWVRERAPRADYLFSVCTGAFVLGRAGLLDSLTVTTFHRSIESLRETVPTATVLDDARFVDNGRVITTAGISAGIDGALHLVARIQGEAAAQRIVKYMEYDNWQPGRGVIRHRK